ncbi:MAG: MarR family transcriptional regulator [Caldilineaceae bacterium]
MAIVLYWPNCQPGLLIIVYPLMHFHHSHFLQAFHTLKTLKLSGLISEDLSFAEYVMLELIAELADEAGSRDVWVADIVKRVEITPQAVSKFIRLAASKGHIERFENENDRRSTGVRITERGSAVLRKTEEELTTFFKSVLEEFSEEELATMSGLMRKLQSAAQVNYAKYKKK